MENLYSAYYQRVASTYIYIVSLPRLLYPSCSLCFHYTKLHCYNFHSSPLGNITMHLSTFLVTATALCATSASAGCFNTGKNWGNHDQAKSALSQGCHGITGPYGSQSVKQVCQNAISPNLSFNFQVNNKSGRAVTISQADCEKHIGGIIDNCGHGGDVTVNGVVYRYI